jgi:hypothetical protein
VSGVLLQAVYRRENRKSGDFNEKRALVVALPGMRLIPKAPFGYNHLRRPD